MKRMKKWNQRLALFVAIVLLLPSAAFAANDAQGAIDYGNAANWAYYELGEDSGVDVFLLCPTVDTWSEKNSPDLSDRLKERFLYALDLEKGIYADAGRLFSPYYRQMSMNAYKLSEEERAPAQELAYRDVSASFRWYLDHENGGRGIILAGFSQGAQMCLELLKEYYGGDGAEAVSLRDGLVAVYAIGWSVTEEMAEAYPQIVPAKGETDTGVVVSFDCEDGTLSDTLVIPAGTKALSINPLSWRTDGAKADKSLNRGAVMSTGAEPIPALCGAYLGTRGELVVTDVTAQDYPAVIDIFPDGSFHIYDYLFFFTNLKENVAARTDAWRKASPEGVLAGMSTEEKVAQMIMPAFRWYPDANGEKQNVTELPADVAAVLQKYGFAGVTLFAQNTGDTAAAVKLVDDMQKANAAKSGRTQLLVAIDQEGGRVTRLGHGTQMPGNMALGAANDTALTAAAASVIGEELMSMGINFNFAPVLDVNSNPANPIIGTRSFSDDPAVAAAQGVSYMRSLQKTGAISTLKHFPGHGDTATDSHTGLPLIDKSYEELKACELIPFQAAIDAGADAVMTAHIQYPQIETGTYTSKLTGEQVSLPATLSKVILTDILRGDMGFGGVIITDAMDMDAIAKHFDRYDAAKLAIEAGVDILLMPTDTSTPEGLSDLEAYVQRLSQMVKSGEVSEKRVDAAVLRILRLKAVHGLTKACEAADPAASQIVGSAAHHETEWTLTKKTVTLVKNENNTLPLTKENQRIAVLTAYDNEVLSMEYAIGRLRDEGKLARGTEITVQSIQKKTAEEATACAAGAEHVVIITELGSAAGLNNDTAKTVDALIESVHSSGGDAAILSCSLPYDAARYQAADAIVLAWSARGMSEDPRTTNGTAAQYGPSMPAALYLMLSPDETPTGTLPVNIPRLTEELTYSDEILYPRGFGLRYGASEPATREMAVSLLWENAGKPVVNYILPFADVSQSADYAEAVRWAAAEGIVMGCDGRFAPDEPITREQLAAMLCRAANGEENGGAMGLAGYEDADEVSGWAYGAMQWAVRTDLFGEKTKRTLAPRGTVTSAEAAAIILRFLNGGEIAYNYEEYPLERNGIALHLDRMAVEGTQPERNILLIHGVTYSSHEFDIDYEDYSLVRALARAGYAVWRLDIAGFGRSGEVTDGFLPDSDYAAEDIHAAADKILAVTGQKKLDVLGWSWGTVTAGRFAAKYGEQVNKLVLFAPILTGAGAYEVTEPFHYNTWEHAGEDFQRAPDGGFDDSVTDPNVIALYCLSCRRYDGEKSPNGGRRDVCVAADETLIDLTKLKMPTLLLYGDKDPYLNYERLAAARELLPEGSSVELLEGGSHIALLEKHIHRDFQSALIYFLEK